MKIFVATLHFKIDDSLLSPDAVARLKPFSLTNKSALNNIPLFQIVLNKHNAFTKIIQPSLRLDSIAYLEEDSKIFIRTDHFDLAINMANFFTEVTPSSKWPNDTLAILKVLKLLISIVCVEHQSILLHSSMVFKDDIGLVFTGQSGAGKTTILKLLRFSWNLMNDEYNILSIRNNQVIGYSTPFGKIKGQFDSQPSINAIFFIKQSTTNRIEPCTEHGPAFRLMKNVCSFPSTDSIGLKLIENINTIVDMVYVSDLHFTNNREFVCFLEQFRTAA
jgi:hypothetical protein